MDPALHYESFANPANHEWMDVIQWDGQGESTSTRQDASPRVYPVSPAATSTSDQNLSSCKPNLAKQRNQSTDLPTPGQSSASPEVRLLPDLRLSGETLRNPSPVRSSKRVLKRKLSDEQASLAMFEPHPELAKPASKKRPHNVIEKRYRANLNDKIAELRDSIPSLRNAKKGGPDIDVGEGDEDDIDGVAPSNKLNKASILTKAVEYIRHLELRNKKLDDENLVLKQRLRTLDKVFALDGNSSAQRAAAFTSQTTVEPCLSPQSVEGSATQSDAQKSHHPPQGLIPVPEAMRRLRANLPQEHYGFQFDTPAEEQKGRGKWTKRFMLGSMAGLMIIEGFGESEQGSDSKEKGLFGIPVELLDGYWFLRSPQLYLAAFLQYCRSGGIFPLMKGFVALTVLAFVIFTYLFNSKPSVKTAELTKPQRVPSLASPIEVRRLAWLTSMQTLKLPHHSFMPEWFAVNAEWCKYSVRMLLGWTAYSWLTSRSTDDELARVKAWDIAIDAQLAGGDPEISRSRLVLTIVGSGLLPRTPARLMLKALHCRMVLWKVGCSGGWTSQLANKVAKYFANNQWRAAQHLHAGLGLGHPDRLAPNLTALLDSNCDDAMLDSVVQRAYNLMYDRPTPEDTGGEDSLMDVVVEDHSIRSPLDAVAAWRSSHDLRQALIVSLKSNSESWEKFSRHLRSALTMAPSMSTAHTRALCVRAAFFEQSRRHNIQTVLNALPQAKQERRNSLGAMEIPYFIDSSTPESARGEIWNILQCAMIMVVVDKNGTYNKYADTENTPANAVNLFSLDHFDPLHISLLSFAPAYYVLQQILQGDHSLATFASCEKLLMKLNSWSHIEGFDSSCIPPNVVTRLDELCSSFSGSPVNRRYSSVSNDTGYASLDEVELRLE